MNALKVPDAGTIVDRIIAFKTSEKLMHLAADEQQVMERADYADNLIRNDLHRRDKDIALQIHNHFGVSLVTAYKDINNALRIHGSTKKYTKDYWISFLIEHARLALSKSYETRSMKNIIAAIHEFREVIKLMPEESKDPLDKVQKHSYYLILKNESGSSVKIDLNNSERISEDTILQIEQSMEHQYTEETIDILHEQLTPDNEATEL